MEEEFLYKTLEALDKAGMLKDIPSVITSNLNEEIKIRDYQKKAFEYFITYFENPNLVKNKQIHTLFQMATGSGKTVIMAGLIFYLYTKGYRNFLFFVNQTNILEKTKDNFINSLSSKYLFNKNLNYLGDKIKINLVNNFSIIPNDNDIQICFTTTQKLHLDLITSKENSLTYNDFENNKIVFISDESHHINSITRRATADEIEDMRSWETSVMNAFRSNKDNILLEFTATANLKDKNVKSKYKDKIIFNYDLKEFRESGYTKDFENFISDSNLWDRTLMALVLSEYRKYKFSDLKKNIKPVLMLKSQKIAESESFYDDFFEHIEKIDSYEIKKLYKNEILLLNKALDYFKEKDESFELLVNSIKSSFTKENTIVINGTTDNTKEKQMIVNSLEESNNPIRVIFAVDMLNEGWDVLNLFDIVRLYDTRQGSGRAGQIGTYTIKEAQLIGRGVRYCPFDLENGQDKFKRKYDEDILNSNRILETMLFHSKNDSRYIAELRQALIESGIEPENKIKLEYKLKEEFKNTEFYNNAYVYSNKRIIKNREEIKDVEGSLKNRNSNYHINTNQGSTLNLFENTDSGEDIQTNIKVVKFKEIPYNILEGASERYSELKFNVIKNKYPNVESLKEFLTSDNYLGNNTIEITYKDIISGKELRNACIKSLRDIANHVAQIKSEYMGSKEFTPIYLKQILHDKCINVTKIEENGGRGDSQNNCRNEIYRTDLTNDNWYVFNDNYGTSEEKQFIKYFKNNIVPILTNMGVEFYLIRNERIPELALYSFKDGEKFEPDFLLFIKKKGLDKSEIKQIYIEPKGEHLLITDKWKEDFMSELENNFQIDSTFVDGNDYEILGLPFYNEQNTKDEFNEEIVKIIEKIK